MVGTYALDSTSRGARERLRDGVGRRGGEHREAQRGMEEGGGGRQVQRPSKLVTKKLRLDRERALLTTEPEGGAEEHDRECTEGRLASWTCWSSSRMALSR